MRFVPELLFGVSKFLKINIPNGLNCKALKIRGKIEHPCCLFRCTRKHIYMFLYFVTCRSLIQEIIRGFKGNTKGHIT